MYVLSPQINNALLSGFQLITLGHTISSSILCNLFVTNLLLPLLLVAALLLVLLLLLAPLTVSSETVIVHIITVPSAAAVANSLPLGENSTHHTSTSS